MLYAPYLLQKLTEGLLPIRVEYPERASLRYSFLRKGEGWVVVLMSNSLDKTLVLRSIHSGQHIDADHVPERFPIALRCSMPVADAIEWTEDRDVPLSRDGETTVARLEIPAGAVRIVELQPEPIDLGREERPVNLALDRPVRASSETKGHRASSAVDGDASQRNGWWSGTGKNKYDMPLPQWLEVDLGAVKTVNAARIWFAWSSRPSVKYRFYRYVIEGSRDREKWHPLVDESQNVDLATAAGLMRWFAPVEARYVRVNVLYSATNEGAMINEIELYGDETRSAPRARKPAPGAASRTR